MGKIGATLYGVRAFPGKNQILNVVKEKKLYDIGEEKPTALYYEVVYRGEIVFQNPCYAICNSYICINMLQGVRPKAVYP